MQGAHRHARTQRFSFRIGLPIAGSKIPSRMIPIPMMRTWRYRRRCRALAWPRVAARGQTHIQRASGIQLILPQSGQVDPNNPRYPQFFFQPRLRRELLR